MSKEFICAVSALCLAAACYDSTRADTALERFDPLSTQTGTARASHRRASYQQSGHRRMAAQERIQSCASGDCQAYGGGCGACCDGCCECAACCQPTCCQPWANCDPCGPCEACCGPSDGWLFGAELLLLKPHTSRGTGSPSPPGLSTDPDFETSYRVWLGYQSCGGPGWRVRYWQFDHDHGEVVNAFNVTDAWDTYYWDLEVTSSFQVACGGDVTLSGGLRYVDYEEALVLNGPAAADGVLLTTEFQGIGLTLGGEYRQRLTCHVGLYADLRWSIVMGDNPNEVQPEVNNQFTSVFAPERLNDVNLIYEAAVGGEYIWPMCGCGYFFLRGGVELSYWDGIGLPFDGAFDLDSAGASTGFGGFTISAGIQR